MYCEKHALTTEKGEDHIILSGDVRDHLSIDFTGQQWFLR